MLEITVTHVIGSNTAERLSESDALELLSRRWIGTGTEGLGPDPSVYPTPEGQRAITLFNRVGAVGAAVVASFPGLKSWPKQYRVVGLVRPGTAIERVGRLIALPLTDARVFDSSRCFLGNLPAVQCTLQSCGPRAQGRLAKLALREPLPRDLATLHARDVEWLVFNHLIRSGMCRAVWGGGHAYPTVDQVRIAEDGTEVLVQTTISTDPQTVRKKVTALLALGGESRRLVLAARRCRRGQCEPPVELIPLHALQAGDSSIV